MQLTIDARKAGRWLLIAVVLMNAIAFGVIALTRMTDRDEGELARLFDVAEEGNITAWASALLLLVAALLLAVAAKDASASQDRDARSWWILAGVFVYLSLDEAAAIHEILIEPAGRLTNATGPFRYGWIVIALPLLALLALMLVGFIRRLEASTRRAFLLAAALFVGGAVGVEVIGGMILDAGEAGPGINRLFVTVEETLENMGTAVFIGALLRHLATTPAGSTTVRIV